MLAGTVGSNRAVMTHIVGSLVLTGGLLLAAVLRAALGDSRVSGRTVPFGPRGGRRQSHPVARTVAHTIRPSRLDPLVARVGGGVAGGVARRTRVANQLNPKTLQGLMQTGVILTSWSP